jgi:hypothetical protein
MEMKGWEKARQRLVINGLILRSEMIEFKGHRNVILFPGKELSASHLKQMKVFIYCIFADSEHHTSSEFGE